MILHIVLLIIKLYLVSPIVSLASPVTVRNVADCSCGYYDPDTGALYTDATIVYFNETTSLPRDVFEEETYENKYEKGWNTRYRQGASTSNVKIAIDEASGSNDSSLGLWVDPSTSKHLVVGGAVRTQRHDMFYGSFRTLMRSPRSWVTGSALSISIDFNDTQTINFDLMNPDDPSKAWVGMFVRDEFPDRKLGVDYTDLANSSNGILPWDFTEYRVDWSNKEINYFIGGKIFRTVQRHGTKDYPITPTPLRLKHWSVGNWFTMQGPPKNRSMANVGWTRFFFNSSQTTDEEREAFAIRCTLKDACSTEDSALRGHSPYTLESTSVWIQAQSVRSSRQIPVIIMIICGSISLFLLANAFLKRVPSIVAKTKAQREAANAKLLPHSTSRQSFGITANKIIEYPILGQLRATSFYGELVATSSKEDWPEFALRDYIHVRTKEVSSSDDDDEVYKPQKTRTSWREFSEAKQNLSSSAIIKTAQSNMTTGRDDKTTKPFMHYSQVTLPTGDLPDTGDEITPVVSSSLAADKSTGLKSDFPGACSTGNSAARPPLVYGAQTSSRSSYHLDDLHKASEAFCTCEHKSMLKIPITAPLLAKKERIDYLAGLLGFGCIIITLIQFCLTFSPASVDPGADPHYDTETWARKTVDSYFLNLIWVGPFLITSARFLVSDYLESEGDLLRIAEKTVSRPFRLLIPVLAIAMLTYFFMDSGAVNWLEYLASVTWSTWPFTRVPNNFGYFISEIIELAYLIPNAAPQITFNFCTGVLWTIPVQLQNSWVTLLGVIIIREIKSTWKRFGYYVFCIVIHWYALSWGSYFYFGILLADLEINYQFRTWLARRPLIYVLTIVLCLAAALGGLSIDAITQWTDINYAAFEYGIHPDIPTGLPIMFTGAANYPQYYVPKLNGMVFAFGIQLLVEISPVVQSIFSSKIFLAVFPHIFSIYLIHGFVFWSLGATVFVFLAAKDFIYWEMVLIVAVCCYSALLLGVPLLTPLLDTLGKDVPRNIWIFGHEKPSPRQPTLYPFPSNFLFVRQAFTQDAGPEAAAQQGDQVVTTKPRGQVVKIMAALAAIFSSRFSNQPCKPDVSISRSGSLRRQSSVKVGWRTGGLSKNVAMLRRNNIGSSGVGI